MPINLNDGSRAAVAQLASAFAADDKKAVEDALDGFQSAIKDDLAVQYKQAVAEAERSGDRAVLAQRGFRQLTSDESRFYERLIDALKSSNPQQAFATIAGTDDAALPNTVIDQVLDDIAEEHELLGAIKMQNTSLLTTWIKNDYDEQFAAWGTLESAITKEIQGGIKVKQVSLNKLSCFALLSLDMLALGPTFMDAYVRTALGEAMACAMEKGIISGIGVKGEPVGLDREFKSTTSVNQTTGYPAKKAKAVTEFSPASYGALVANLMKDEDGKEKKDGALGSLTLICNSTDYLTKVVPATTVLNTAGAYVNDLFPVPTRVIRSRYVGDGKAILALLDEYTMFAGPGAGGIEYSDEFKFLDHQRTFRVVSYAYGEPKDDTTAIVLDISGLDPAYVTVKQPAAKASSDSSKA